MWLDVHVEVTEAILSSMMGTDLPAGVAQCIRRRKIGEFTNGKPVDLLTEEEKVFTTNTIKFFNFMSYDYIPEQGPTLYYRSIIIPKRR